MTDNTRRRIFVSHSSIESDLATSLAAWLERSFSDVECFCTSRPGEIRHGSDWRQRVMKEARNQSMIILLLSPDTVGNPWIQLEAGIAMGADDASCVVPAIYGGLRYADIPSTLQNRQALNLQDDADFDTFVSREFTRDGSRSADQTRQKFLEASPRIARFLRFGGVVGWEESPAITVEIPGRRFTIDDESLEVALERDGRRLVAARARVRPRRTGETVHWKCGFQLFRRDPDNSQRLFEVHSSHHEGLMTLALYARPGQIIPVSIPANFSLEQDHELQMWFSPNHRKVQCLGIDCLGRRVLILDDRGSKVWHTDATDDARLIFHAWADGRPYQIDLESLEIDYA